MKSISKENLEQLLIRMFGELNYNKKEVLAYLQGLEDFNIVEQEDVDVFKNYIKSNLTRSRVVEILAPKNRKEVVLLAIEEIQKQKKGGKNE